MQNYYLKKITADEEKEIKLLKGLEESELADYHLLGGAGCINIFHAASLAHAHCRGFWHRVAGFRVVGGGLGEMFNQTMGENKYIKVEFYEKKDKADSDHDSHELGGFAIFTGWFEEEEEES